MTDPRDNSRTSVQPAREVVKSASRAFLSIHHWQGRMVLWGAAAAVGAAAVGFAWLADAAQAIFRRLHSGFNAWPWIVTPVGFVITAWLTRRFFPGAEGSGIPQTIFAVQPDSGARGDRLLDPKVVVGRVLLAGARYCHGCT